jgi:hypothetical protein
MQAELARSQKIRREQSESVAETPKQKKGGEFKKINALIPAKASVLHKPSIEESQSSDRDDRGDSCAGARDFGARRRLSSSPQLPRRQASNSADPSV